MSQTPETLSAVPGRFAPFGRRRGAALMLGLLLLSACGSGRDEKLAEQIAQAKTAAVRAEKAQKAAELALAKLQGAQPPQPEEPEEKEEPEVVEGEDGAEGDETTTDDDSPSDATPDSEVETDGEAVPSYAVRNARQARAKANTEG